MVFATQIGKRTNTRGLSPQAGEILGEGTPSMRAVQQKSYTALTAVQRIAQYSVHSIVDEPGCTLKNTVHEWSRGQLN